MTSQQTQEEANKAIIRRYREAHNANDMAALDDIVAADLISHNSFPGLPSGREGGKMAHQGVVAAFADGRTTSEDLVAEGDKVVERFSFRGTHTGAFLGVPPTGKIIQSTGISVFRIANGQIVEHWGENDGIGVMIQLGVLPPPN
ncbi:MAG: ester cyclase [Roseiflexaceae bacterium]